MSQNHCPRAWEAEALEDGQLAGSDKASFERHALACSTCRREVEALARLRAIMQRVAKPEATPLELRRSRISLLDRASRAKRASADTEGTELGPRRWRVAFAAAALVACLVTIGGFWMLLHATGSASTPPVAARSAAPPVFDVADVDSAVWTTQVEGPLAHPSLKDGVAAFHVEPMGTGQRFLLGLPDGELEVRGTRFVVEVHDGRTDSVRVTEGVVALRMRGQDERLLRAGDRWSRMTEPRATAPRVPTADADPRGPGEPAESSALAVRPLASATGATTNAPAARPRPPTPGPGRGERSVASERFAVAERAFRGGDYAQADSLLASFVQEFPGDSRAEDAAFLRAVARSRSGDRAAAAALARAYLQGYPHGLRRREAEQLMSDGAASPAPASERDR
jgi:hypothetical protein